MLNSNNLALHALANCCKDSLFGTLEKYRVDRQLNLVSASYYVIKEYLLILLFYFCVLLFIVLYVCLLCSVDVLLLRHYK